MRYTIVPMNGNSDAAVAQATSIGSAIRRWASLYVQYTSASQMTTRNSSSRLTASANPSFSMPNKAIRPMKRASVLGAPYRKSRPRA